MNILHAVSIPSPLGTALQPIVDISTGKTAIFAVECLTRGPRGSRLEQATPLFEYIRRRHLELEMDQLCVAASLRAAAAQPYRMSINVHPASLGDRRDFAGFFLSQCEMLKIDPQRLIVEIGEQSPAADAVRFATALRRLRAAGVAIAVDDVGFGHSNHKAILDCAPEYLKIDRYFVDGAAGDRGRVAVARSILDLADHFGAHVIAEGVERQEDFETLRGLGIRMFQGFLFSRPIGVSRDRSQHPFIDRVLKRHKPLQQPLVDVAIDCANA